MYSRLNLYLGKKDDPTMKALSYLVILENSTLSDWIKRQMMLGFRQEGLITKGKWNNNKLEQLKKKCAKKIAKESKGQKNLEKISAKYNIKPDMLTDILVSVLFEEEEK